MQKFQLKKIAMTLSLSLAITAQAAGLGGMTSNSKLGEPLNAEIELLSVSPAEISSLQATLASDQVYQDQLLEKPASYPFIKIDIANNQKGQPVLKLISTQPITEAFLDMLIQVDWPTGRLVKEYTLLLDPPGFNSNYVSDANSPPIVNESVVKPQNEPAVNLGDTRPATRPEEVLAPDSQANTVAAPPAAPARAQAQTNTSTAQNSTPLNSLTTERGDTLYAIARQMKPDQVSTEQMLIALYQANRQAFEGNNINRLKVGEILKLPDDAAVSEIAASSARQQVSQHHAEWMAYKQTLAGVVKQSVASETGHSSQRSAGKIASTETKKSADAPIKDVLKLAAGDEKQSATQRAKPDAIAAKDEATAKANAIKEEQARAAALEKQVADMKKLMAMKNEALKNEAAQAAAIKSDSLAQAEKNAAETQAPAPTAPVVAPTAPPPAPAPAPMAAAPAAPAAEVAPSPEPVSTSFMQALLARIKQSHPLLPVALLGLPALLGIWAVIRNRRKKQIDTFEDVIVTAPATELQNNTVFGDTRAAGSSDTSFLTDFSQSGVGGMIDAHDVDPIAEAEVYMAYGRDAQAEEILKDAIQKDPQRQELKVKLLEIYQGAGNKAAFETLATELYAATGAQDPLWAKASALGQKLDADNPLYQVANGAAESNVSSSSTLNASTQASVPLNTTLAAEASEQGYHFNVEPPALEFEGATQAVTAAVSEMPSFTAASVAAPAAASLASTSQTAAADTMRKDATLDWKSSAEGAADGAADAIALVSEDASSAALQVGNTFSEAQNMLTPKSLDLPSLELEDTAPAVAIASLPTVGEPALSDTDAVFEALPELSLELGSVNGPDTLSMDNDGLALDDFTIESALDAASELAADGSVTAPAMVADHTPSTLPDLSLEMTAAELPPAQSAEAAEAAVDEPEEVNTKLDLIQAYIDMEDLIGARELIEEVLTEGSARQQARATALLEKLS